MDVFTNSIRLDDITEQYCDLVVQHLKVDPDIRDVLWDKDMCLIVAFDRCWDINLLNKFITDNFPKIKYLQIICDNYMVRSTHNEFYDFTDFPSTITHCYIRCPTHSNLGYISMKHIENTNLETLMIQGRVIEEEYSFPETLSCFIRGCKNTDHEKRLCLPPIPLNWNKRIDILQRLKEFDFPTNRCGFMEINTKYT